MDEFALIYDAAAQRGISPAECDASEIWVLAAALGANRPDEDEGAPGMDGDGFTFNQRRAIALTKGEKPPSWDEVPLTAAEIEGQRKLMAMLPMVGPSTLPPE